MAFAYLVYNASTLLGLKLDLMQEKVRSIQLHRGEITEVKPTKLIYRWKDFWKKVWLCHYLPFWDENAWLEVPEEGITERYKFKYRLLKSGTFENFVFRSFLGYCCGVILTYAIFIHTFMFYLPKIQMFDLAPLVFLIVGSILTLGLAFSYRVRCLVCLALPIVFSKKAQKALIGYALVLALAGPAKNTVKNTAIMAESIACVNREITGIFKNIFDCNRHPLLCDKDYLINLVKQAAHSSKFQHVVQAILRTCKSVLATVGNGIRSLMESINMCNSKLGTPYQRCVALLASTDVDCFAKLGRNFQWLCGNKKKSDKICSIAKTADVFCEIGAFLAGSLTYKFIKSRINKLMIRLKDVFHLKIVYNQTLVYNLTFKGQQWNKTMNVTVEAIKKEISDRLYKILDIYSILTMLGAAGYSYSIIIKIGRYYLKYLVSSRFDNKYITDDFLKLDERRLENGVETVLPLTEKEMAKYGYIFTPKLLASEKKEMTSNAVLNSATCLKLIGYITADYSLYWTLNLINRSCNFRVFTPWVPKFIVLGTGLLNFIIQGIVNMFEPDINIRLNLAKCVPTPMPPFYEGYFHIFLIMIWSWFLIVCEPFGLRFRHVVMGYYFPGKTKERTFWLYYHILDKRSRFLKASRRELRHKAKSDEPEAVEVKKPVTEKRISEIMVKSDKVEVTSKSVEAVGPVGLSETAIDFVGKTEAGRRKGLITRSEGTMEARRKEFSVKEEAGLEDLRRQAAERRAAREQERKVLEEKEKKAVKTQVVEEPSEESDLECTVKNTFKWMQKWYKGKHKKAECFLCGLNAKDNTERVFRFYKCQSVGCKGVYCEQCFIDLKYLCPICLMPIDYGDVSDISEEVDSSGSGSSDEPFLSADSDLSTDYQYEKDISIRSSDAFFSMEMYHDTHFEPQKKSPRIIDVSSDTSIENAGIILGYDDSDEDYHDKRSQQKRKKPRSSNKRAKSYEGILTQPSSSLMVTTEKKVSKVRIQDVKSTPSKERARPLKTRSEDIRRKPDKP